MEAAKAQASSFGGLLLPLVLAGIALILVNTLSARFIGWWSERVGRRQELQRRLRPVLKAAADLVSRLSDILIAHQSTYLAMYKTYKDQDKLARFKSLRPLEMNRFESTGFRLVNLLLLAEEFRRRTSDTPAFRKLERAEFFLQHKIPVALRGNLYGYQLIGTEAQEEIAAAALRSFNNRPGSEFSVGDLCSFMSSGTYDRELFNVAVKVFQVDTTCLQDASEIDRNAAAWLHILTLAHFGVYLIDFFQDLANNCQWEEQRLLFVKLIKEWNTGGKRHRYLYEPGDLEGTNLLDSYPGRLAPRGFAFDVARRLAALLRVNRLASRIAKYLTLNRRGLKFWRRHHPKTIHSWGIKIRGQDRVWTIKLRDDLRTVFRDVGTYLESRSV